MQRTWDRKVVFGDGEEVIDLRDILFRLLKKDT